MLRKNKEWIYRKSATNVEKFVEEIKPISFAELEKRYETWCKHHRIPTPKIPPPIKVVDPIFGTTIPQEELRSGKISLAELAEQTDLKKQKGKRLNGNSEVLNVENTLGEFSDVISERFCVLKSM